MIKLAIGWAFAIALALAAVSSATGQEPDIQIVELDCNSDPEMVVIENGGSVSQALAGWKLQSDPPDSEVYDLSVLSALQPGGSVFIQSGPSATGIFKWGLDFVFRDNDATDYARIVDDTGAVVDEVNCGGGVAPGPSPTPSPQPSPLNGVPNGGGAPPPTGHALLAAMMLLIGGSIAAAGVVTGALSWLRLRSLSLVGTTGALTPWEAAARPHAQPRGAGGSRGEPISAALRLALVGLFAASLAFRLLRHRPQ